MSDAQPAPLFGTSREMREDLPTQQMATPHRMAVPTSAPSAPSPIPPPLIGLTAVGDRCVACASPLLSDQRYCVTCGERRDRPRFTLAQAAPAPAAAPPARRTPRATPGSTLIAGVGTLLLAMGVGVLIGHYAAAGAKAPAGGGGVHLTVTNGPSSAPTAAATTASSSTAGAQSSAHGKAGKAKATHKASSGKAAAAAKGNSSLPGGGAATATNTVTVGSKGSGAGYQNGHFTGNFFGN